MSYANANLAALGLVAGDLTPVTAAQTTWASAFPGNVSAQAALTATQTKKTA